MRSTTGKAAALALALGLLAAACSKSSTPDAGGSSSAAASGSQEPSKTMTIGSDTANDHGEVTVTSKTSLEVEQDNFYFNPTVLTGSPGQSLTINLKNEGTVPHNFSIDAQTISQDVQPDGTASVTVTFPKSGFVEFYCRFHRSSGMVGELTVA